MHPQKLDPPVANLEERESSFHHPKFDHVILENAPTSSWFTLWPDRHSIAQLFCNHEPRLARPLYVISGHLNRRARAFGLLALCLISFGIVGHQFAPRAVRATVTSAAVHFAPPAKSPFSGAFAKFPPISALSKEQRRISGIAIWNNDHFPEYMRHFLYSAGLNADSLDLLFINRKTARDSKCIDFGHHGVNISANVKVVCMSDDEYKQRHVNLMCGDQFGWRCTDAEYKEVKTTMAKRPDAINANFRPLHGWMFRDLLLNPQSLNWAWLDVDMIIGDLTRFPYNILSQSTMAWGHAIEFDCFYMAGQFTAFRFDDPGLIGSWKMIPQLKTPKHFTRNLEGEFEVWQRDEVVWSSLFLQSAPGYPGNNVTYVVYPAWHGDDYGNPENTTFVVSGRDIFSVSDKWTREQIERLIELERLKPVDDLGGIGWTGGIDGSQYLVENPEMSGASAKARAIADATKSLQELPLSHQGFVEDVEVMQGFDGTWIIKPNDLAHTEPQMLRTSYARFRGQKHNHILRRHDLDDRPRGWERKLLRHHYQSKHKLKFPSFEIKEDMIMRWTKNGKLEVWKMGPKSREKTL